VLSPQNHRKLSRFSHYSQIGRAEAVRKQKVGEKTMMMMEKLIMNRTLRRRA